MLNEDLTLEGKNNNFNLIRLILSIGVVCSHAFDLFPSTFPYTFAEITQVGTLGECCVFQFFGLSGFLIFRSFLRSKSFIKFLTKRFLRLWPGLLVCISLTTVVLGPLATQMSTIDYFENSQTFKYWLGNISLYTVNYHLPGVFTENYYKDIVNGSIWSLRVEFICYFILLFNSYFVYRYLPFLETLHKSLSNVVIISLLILYIIVLILLCPNTPKIKLLIELKSFFIVGIAFYMIRENIKFNFSILILLIVTWLCLKHTLFNKIIYYLLIFYLLYCLAFAKYIRTIIKSDADLCYGVYIYSFPIQQLLYLYLPNLTSLSSLILTIPVVLFFAYFSWYMVERPFIKLIV